MSTHYGRMVATDDALMLFSDPDRGDGAPDGMSRPAVDRAAAPGGERVAALDRRPRRGARSLHPAALSGASCRGCSGRRPRAGLEATSRAAGAAGAVSALRDPTTERCR